MTISGMVKNSFVDYPGLISCVLFVSGCNYDCFYCHNRSLLDGTQPSMEDQNVRDFLEKRKGLIDAVVISGGEPTLQNGLFDYLQWLRKSGYKIKLDTNGSSPDVISTIVRNDLCDYFAVDYKAPYNRYIEICGEAANAANVLQTISLLLEKKVDFEVRTTVIPQLKESDLMQMAKELPVIPRFTLNRYRLPENYKSCDHARINSTPYSQKEIDIFARAMTVYQPNMNIQN